MFWKRPAAVSPPSSTRSQAPDDGPGCSLCGICRVCTCISLGFFSTPTGVVKGVELLMGALCQLLILKYGME